MAGTGFPFGVLVSHSGLAWWWATVFATVIFAGSLEFLFLQLVTAVAPLGQIAVTALLVNVRHVFYTLSFPLHQVPGAAAKTYSTFALTDEAYALSTRPEARTWPRARILALQATIHLFWVGSVTAGALAGTLVPDSVRGLDFAVSALFVVLALEAVRTRRDVPVALVAAGCAAVAQVLAPGALLLVAFALFTGYLVVRERLGRHRRHGREADA